MAVEVTIPEEFQGSVMAQISKRHGLICGTDSNQGWFTVVAEVSSAILTFWQLIYYYIISFLQVLAKLLVYII